MRLLGFCPHCNWTVRLTETGVCEKCGSRWPDPTSPDPVNHPPHYTSHPSGVECITVARHFSFNLGNVLKYIWRAALKGATLEDLKKARWYLDDEIKQMEKK